MFKRLLSFAEGCLMLVRSRLVLLATCGLAVAASAGVARAAEQLPVHITVISDQDDDIYDARSGRGGVDATRMAVADFGGTALGRPIIVDALNDHNKPAEAPDLATRAYDAGADLLMDCAEHADCAGHRQGGERTAQTGDQHRLGRAGFDPRCLQPLRLSLLLRRDGNSNRDGRTTSRRKRRASAGCSFRKIPASAAAGIATMTPVITAGAHGQIVKSIVMPPTTGDYTRHHRRSARPQPRSGGGDRCRRQGRHVGVSAVTKAGLPAVTTTALLYLSDVDRVQGGYAGVQAAVPWYWNLDPAARAWSDRFAAAHDGRRPTETQAADYSATTQWLNAVRTAGTTDADAVIHALDGHKFNDFFAHDGEFRASDHAVVHDLYVVKVRDAGRAAGAARVVRRAGDQ